MTSILRTLAAALPVAGMLAYAASADARLLCSTQVRLVRTYQLHYAPQYQRLAQPAAEAGAGALAAAAVPRLGAIERHRVELVLPRVEPRRGTLATPGSDGALREEPVSLPALEQSSMRVGVSLPDFGSRVVDVPRSDAARQRRLGRLNAAYARDVSRAANLLAGCLPRQLTDVRERVGAAYASAISAWRELAVRMRALPPGARLLDADGDVLDAERTLETLRDARQDAINDLLWLSAGIAHARLATERVDHLRRF